MDISEGIDVNKTNELKDCFICHYWYFIDKGFKFQSDVLNGYHDISMMSTNLDDVTILNINGVDYHCSINGISKIEAKNLLQKFDLTKKK